MRPGLRISLAVLLALAACGDDGGTAPDAGELTGNWRATKIEYASVANSSQKVDLTTLGVTVTLTLNAGSTYLLITTAPGQAAQTLSGTWTANRDVLTLKWTGQFSGEMQFDMALSGTSLTLSGADADYDFNGDDQDDPAKLTLVLVRQ
jgi:hypothetical protein